MRDAHNTLTTREEAPNTIGGKEEGEQRDKGGVEGLRVASVEVTRFPFPLPPAAEREAVTSRPRSKAGPLSSKAARGPAKEEGLRSRSETRSRPDRGRRRERTVGGASRRRGVTAIRCTDRSPPPPGAAGGLKSDDDSYRSASTNSFSSAEDGSEVETRSVSASGATKRARSVSRSRTPLKARHVATSDEDGDDIVVVDDGEEERGPALKEPRGRGRPPTTGEGLMAEKRREAKGELAALRKEAKEVEVLLRGDYDPEECKARSRERRERLLEQVPNIPSRDLVSRMLEGAQRIDGIAVKSKNIKGTLIKELRDTAAFFAVAADALFARGTSTSGDAADSAAATSSLEANCLRLENEALREELGRLRRAEDDRAMMPPPPPLPEAAKGGDHMEVDDTPLVSRLPARRAVSSSPGRGERKNRKGRKEGPRPPQTSPAPPPADIPRPSGEPLPLGREEVRRMVEEQVGSALRDLSSNLERTIGEQIRRALGGLLPLQTVSGDGARVAPRTTAPPSSQGKKGGVVQGGRPVPEPEKAQRGKKRGGAKPQPRSGDGARKGAPETAAPLPSQGRGGAAARGERPVPKAGVGAKREERGKKGKGGKAPPPRSPAPRALRPQSSGSRRKGEPPPGPEPIVDKGPGEARENRGPKGCGGCRKAADFPGDPETPA